MKTTHTLTAAALALAVLTACNSGQQNTEGTNSAPTAATTPATTDTPPAGADVAGGPPVGTDATATGNATSDAAMTPLPPPGEAMGWMTVVDEHEIAAAEQARSKKVDGKVLDYANMMHKEHTQHLEQTRALAKQAGTEITTTGVAAQQRAKGEAERARLAALNGDEYERAYIEAMVKDHADVLAMLDRMIAAPATQDPLKQHLTTTRAAVSKHLDQARALQSEAGGGTGGTTGTGGTGSGSATGTGGGGGQTTSGDKHTSGGHG